MSENWQRDLVAEIRKIDEEQEPGGLYSLPDVLRVDHRLQPLTRIFSDCLFGGESRPDLDLAARLGWGSPSSLYQTLRCSLPNERELSIEVRDYASTKVRRYGGAYVLDKVYGKGRPEDSKEIEKWVAKLPRRNRLYRFPENVVSVVGEKLENLMGNRKVFGGLLIAYVPREADFERILGKAEGDFFLARYELSFSKEVWKDPHRRDFWTGAFFWCFEGSY